MSKIHLKQLSPDVLRHNPDLARAAKKSKAVTPSGKGHGHTDDIQDFDRPPRLPVMQLCLGNAKNAYGLLCDPAMGAELAAIDITAHMRLLDALAVLKRLRKALEVIG
jgi:hypothetical protein